MQELDLHDMYFQQHGANSTCNNRPIEKRSGPVNRPPKSCDLTPLDYFLWGYVKAHVYTDKLASIDAVEDSGIREISAEILEKVCQNSTKLMDHLRFSRVQHLHEIIFKH